MVPVCRRNATIYASASVRGHSKDGKGLGYLLWRWRDVGNDRLHETIGYGRRPARYRQWFSEGHGTTRQVLRNADRTTTPANIGLLAR